MRNLFTFSSDMKKLYFKVGLLLLLVGVVNVFLSRSIYKKVTPFFWGNQAITDKRNYIVKNKDDYNLMFFGSSKTFHQIDPVLFDSIVSKDMEVHSFNYGIQNLLPPESFYLYENLLKEDSLHFKYVLMELNWFPNIKYKNLHTRRNFYWLNNDNYVYTINSAINSRIPLPYKVWTVGTRSVNYIDKTFNIGIVNEIFNYHAQENDETALTLDVLKDNKGFLPVNRDSAAKGKNSYFLSERYRKEIEEVKRASSVSFAKYEDVENFDYYNEIYFEKINHLIKLSEDRGIHLIFTMPPQWKSYQYDELIPLFEQIPENHKIQFADSRKYPELFKKENLFDADHVNEQGSRILTKLIAEKFRIIVKNYPNSQKLTQN